MLGTETLFMAFCALSGAKGMNIKMKADSGNVVSAAIRQCLKDVRIDKPVYMEYT